MARRYTDGKLGMVFATAAAAQEDHRKPNIIRGASKFSKTPIMRRSNTFETTMFRQAISSSTVVDQNVGTFPVSENQNGEAHFDSLMPSTSEQIDEEDSSTEAQKIYISDEFHQLIQPSEISPLQNHEQLMHASIQTESGNYIMVIRDNEIVSMHSQQLDENGGEQETESVMLEEIAEENGEECEEDLHGATECEEVESSNLECEGVDDAEIISAVQNIDPSSESNLFIESQDEADGDSSIDPQNQNSDSYQDQVLGYVEASNSPSEDSGSVADNSEQYVMVQLPDGNSYLIPASSLEGTSVSVDGSTCGEQIFVNENGDHQVIQVLNTSSGLHLQHASSSVNNGVNVHQTINQSRARARKRGYTNHESSTSTPPAQPQKKRAHNIISTDTNGHSPNNGRYVISNSATSRTIQPQMYTTIGNGQVQYPQQKPLPQSRSRSSASSNVNNKHRPVEDQKPRPFRFDMPELPDMPDPSTDYLSLVISNFQKENYLK